MLMVYGAKVLMFAVLFGMMIYLLIEAYDAPPQCRPGDLARTLDGHVFVVCP
jgi:hypothetical protein